MFMEMAMDWDAARRISDTIQATQAPGERLEILKGQRASRQCATRTSVPAGAVGAGS